MESGCSILSSHNDRLQPEQEPSLCLSFLDYWNSGVRESKTCPKIFSEKPWKSHTVFLKIQIIIYNIYIRLCECSIPYSKMYSYYKESGLRDLRWGHLSHETLLAVAIGISSFIFGYVPTVPSFDYQFGHIMMQIQCVKVKHLFRCLFCSYFLLVQGLG